MNGAGATGLRVSGARIALGPTHTVRADIEICGGRIRGMGVDPRASRTAGSEAEIELSHYLILPGLINAHDHLEFNLFPRLGNGPYLSAREWARDVYRPQDDGLRAHLSIPKRNRLWWGGLKNLLSGVTTVCHHNPYDEETFNVDFPIHVVRRYGWAHSLTFGEDVGRAFRATEPTMPFIIHLGEGTDAPSGEEIHRLDRLGALDQRTVLVHGVGLTAEGHALRRRRGAALIWCPTSNRFTLGATLDVGSIPDREHIALGSDSALTGRGDLLDEIRAVHAEEGIAADALFSMVTGSAAAILRLRSGEGTIRPGGPADLIALPWRGRTPAETLARARVEDVEMVMVAGRLQAASARMVRRWPAAAVAGMEWVRLEGIRRMVRAPVARLLNEAAGLLPDGVRLAAKRVCHD
jgi:cytosine/adenosine deaminase-related metal-dependent hydrolase